MEHRKKIAVVGAGISGLSAAWLLAKRHDVTLFEREPRAGGHSNTVEAGTTVKQVPVDTGFIVYNTASYPNLIALFKHLGVPTVATSMGFTVSLDGGRYEYSGAGLAGFFAQPGNALRPSHLRMLADILRFFREAPRLLASEASEIRSLGDYLTANGYSDAFVERHILPMAAAIWSTPAADVLAFPAAAFVRFFANHGLLQVDNRPEWRTVVGGSRQYVRRLLDGFEGRIALGAPVLSVSRTVQGVTVRAGRDEQRFEDCVIAAHADEALALLSDASADERRLLGAFRYKTNRAVLHRDARQMPRRRRVWSSWNYLGEGSGHDRALTVTYWMNRLQPLATEADLFVTLNPTRPVTAHDQIAAFDYAHPLFDGAAMAAQRQLWSLQGQRNTWFCGSYFGYGFHEDGLQSGLAVAEALGGVRRPWTVTDESGRIHLKGRETVMAVCPEAAE